MTTFLTRFDIKDISTDIIIPDLHTEGECDLCQLTESCVQKTVFWVYDQTNDPEWAPGIYLLYLRICGYCNAMTKHISVVAADTAPDVIEYLFEYLWNAKPAPPQPQLFIGIGPQTLSTCINYFSGHKKNTCDTCRLSHLETELHQKIYICHYRPKRWQPDDANLILFSFDLCKSCYDKTAHEKEGAARFDWDIVDSLAMTVAQ